MDIHMEQMDEDSLSTTTDQAYEESPSLGFEKSEGGMLDFTQRDESLMPGEFNATKQGMGIDGYLRHADKTNCE